MDRGHWESEISLLYLNQKPVSPVQKPHIHTYEGGFSPNTVDRFIENDLND